MYSVRLTKQGRLTLLLETPFLRDKQGQYQLPGACASEVLVMTAVVPSCPHICAGFWADATLYVGCTMTSRGFSPLMTRPSQFLPLAGVDLGLDAGVLPMVAGGPGEEGAPWIGGAGCSHLCPGLRPPWSPSHPWSIWRVCPPALMWGSSLLAFGFCPGNEC